MINPLTPIINVFLLFYFFNLSIVVNKLLVSRDNVFIFSFFNTRYDYKKK